MSGENVVLAVIAVCVTIYRVTRLALTHAQTARRDKAKETKP